jgi:hypothetical protein
VEHRLEPARGSIDTGKRAHHRAEISAIEADSVIAINRADDIEARHAVPGGSQCRHGHFAEFAAAPGNRDAHGLTAPWWR